MKANANRSKWKELSDYNQILTTEFRDCNGTLIRVGDIIEYKRKKNENRLIWNDEIVCAEVKEIIVKIQHVRKGRKSVLMGLQAICVVQKSINGASKASHQVYRLYNTSHVVNKSKQKSAFRMKDMPY